MNRPHLITLSLIAVVALGIAVAGVGLFRYSCIPRNVPVLMYHNVLPARECDSVYKVSVEEFSSQLDSLLAAGYRTVLPADLEKAARFRTILPKKPVVITFDDGYEGTMLFAEPELAKRGMKAICYAIVDRLATNGAPRETFDSGPLMTADEAGAMSRRGTVVLGVHSRTHSRPPIRLVPEIASSRRALRARTGAKSKAYSYPFGQYGLPGMTNAVATAHYTTAVICEDKMFEFSRDADFLLIPRLSVYGGVHDVGPLSWDPKAGVASITNGGTRLPLRAVARLSDGSVIDSGTVIRIGGRDGAAVFNFGRSLPSDAAVEAWDASLLFRYYPAATEL